MFKKYCIPLIVAVILLFSNLNIPFWRHHDFNSNLWSVVAKNYLSHGLFCTKLGQSTTYTPIDNCADLEFYMNHPPLITWVLALSYAVFGISEWAARLPFILFSIGSVILLGTIASNLFDRKTGIMSALLMAATPIFRYYGKAINHEPVVLFFILLLIYFLLKWLKYKKKKYYIFSLISVFLISISGWHGYLIVPLLSLIAWKTNRNKIKQTSFLLIVPIFVFFLLMIQRNMLNTLGDNSLFYWLWARMGIIKTSIAGEISNYDFGSFITVEIYNLLRYFTPLLFIAGLSGLIIILYQSTKQRNITESNLVLVIFFIYGLGIPVIFSQQAINHEYLNYYLLPSICISAGLVLRQVDKRILYDRDLVVWILFVILVLISGSGFVNKLETEANDFAQSQVLLGQTIKNVGIENNYLIISKFDYPTENPFLANYAYGAQLESKALTLEDYLKIINEVEKRFNYLVLVDGYLPGGRLVSFLDNTYPKKILGNNIFYSI